MDFNEKMKKLFNHFFDNDFIKAFLELTIGIIGGTLLILTLTGCEKEYSQGKNHAYTFSGLVVKDQWGVETWGSHHFVTDVEIENTESFKECYVNYLKWSGLDKDGMYNQAYYANPKNIKITYIGTTYQRYTVKAVNNCL